jgi:hypothetical protein
MLCLPLSAFAGKVELARARQAALNWLQDSASDKRLVGKKTYHIIGQEPVVINKKTVGYNFILAPMGHILVPSRDELPVVKLYSFTSTLRMDQESDAARWISGELFGVEDLLDKHAAEMAGVNHGNTHNGRLWARFGKDSASFSRESAALPVQQSETLSLGPLLSTTWNQGEPYNLNTPLWYTGQKTLTGCVATAAAQIMKFWNYPTTGQNSNSYTWNNGSTNQTLSANFASSTYDWANMTGSYGSGSTTVQKQAVARLMSDVGIAFNMGYGVSGSSASTMAGTVFPTYFKYKNTIQAVYRDNYDSDSAWMQVFKNEVQNGRPSQVRISGPPGGHSVVVDGYRDSPSEQIHLNMGWAGSYDGWYVSNNIVAGTYSFTDVDYQAAVIGIEPAVGTSQCAPPAGITVPAGSSGVYTVSWGTSSTEGVTYVLEESESPGFSTVTTAYSGSALSVGITKTSDGIFYYRVKSIGNGYTDSPYATSATGCVVDVPGEVTNLMVNGDFESGSAEGWSQSSDGGFELIYSDGGDSHAGIGYGWLGGYDGGTDELYQDVVIPDAATAVTASFWYKIATEETSNSSANDVLQLAVINPSTGALLQTLTSLSNLNATGESGAEGGQFDLLAFKGQTIRLAFTASMNNSVNTNFYLDDVALNMTLPGVHTLTVNFTGNGSGTVSSSTGFASDTNGSFQVMEGTPMTLTAAAAAYSDFMGWSGSCGSIKSNICNLAMSADKTANASFNLDTVHKARIGSSYFPTLYDAYNSPLSTGNSILAWATGFLESLTCDRQKAVTIDGGYNDAYSGNNGYTTLQGTLTVAAGSLTVGNLIIK